MKIISERKEMIFRNDIKIVDSSGVEIIKPIYKIDLSHKNIDGSYSQGSMLCKFSKNSPELESQTLIYIKNAWIDFYFKEKEKENGEKYKETIPFIFINEFTTLDEAINNGKPDLENKKENNDSVDESDPYKEFSEEITIDPNELPF